MYYRSLCWLLSGSILFSSIIPAYSYGTGITYRTATEAEVYIDEFMKLLGELRSHVDRSQFDLDALLSKLDFDPENIVNYVKQEVQFEQYPGLLRGAQGTLMSRAGNALDQSVLLGKLLKDAGYEARIAGTTLSSKQAKDLLGQMFISQNTNPPPGDMNKLNAVMVKLGRLSGAPDSNLSAFLDAQEKPAPKQATDDQLKARADADFIFRTLGEAGVVLGSPDAIDELIEEARQYFWVEYRTGPSSAWSPVHPAFHNQTDGFAGLKATSTLQDSVPVELQHRFRFRAFIEQKTGNELKEYALMEAWERPVANMAGKALSYANMPRALLSLDDVSKIDEVLASNNVFIPFFENKAAGPNTFDLAGRTIPADVALSGYAGVFESTAETGIEAAGTLATMGRGDENTAEADTSPFILSANWLEYTFIRPNGEETTYRRELLDRIGKSARAGGDQMLVDKMGKQELNLALTSFQSFMVAAGRFPDAYVLDRAIERLMGMRSTISLVIQGKTDPGASAEPP